MEILEMGCGTLALDARDAQGTTSSLKNRRSKRQLTRNTIQMIPIATEDITPGTVLAAVDAQLLSGWVNH